MKLYLSMAKAVMVNAGRAYGKDHVIFLRAQRIMFQLYYEREAMGDKWTRYGPKVLVGVYAPVSKNFKQLWTRFKEMLPDIPGRAPGGGKQIEIYEKEGSETIQIFGPYGIVIEFFSVFKGDSSRGNGYDILVGTEVAFGSERTLTHSLMKLVKRPNHAGYVMLNSSPRGLGYWWDKAVEKARAGKGYWGAYELHEGTWVDNPTSTEDDAKEAAAEKEKNIYTYRRERLAWTNVPDVPDEVLDGEGLSLAFTPELVDGLLVSLPMETAGPYYAGTDLGFSGPDPLCTVVMDHSTGLIVDIIFVPRCTSQGEIMEHIKEVRAKWRPVRHCFDANGRLATKIQGDLSRLNLFPIKTTTSLDGPGSKKEQVMNAEQHFIQKAVRIKNPEMYPGMTDKEREATHTLIMEIRGYRRFELQREQQVGGKIITKTFITYGKGPDGTDDGMDALVMLLQGRNVPAKVKPKPLTAAQVWGD